MTAVLNSLAALLPFLLLLPVESSEGFFDAAERSVTDRYRGFFALAVILHHMAQRVNVKGLLWIWFDAGFIAVAMFFFYSGYGLMKKGIGQKEGFFRKRVPGIVIPYLVTMVIYWIFYALSGDVKSIPSLLMEHLHNESGISFLWYVFVYLAWIVFLGISLHVMKRDIHILYAAFVFACGFVILCLIIIPSMIWIYDTVIMIPLGCAWAYHEDKINDLIHRKYNKVLTGSLAVFIISLPLHLHPLFRVPAYMISSASFMVFLNTVSMKQRPKGKTLSFLGRISFEIYLLHGLPVTFCRDIINNEALWTLAVIVIAVVSAYLMHMMAERTWKRSAVIRNR